MTLLLKDPLATLDYSDSQCRAAIGSILAMLRTHGLIAS